MKKYQCIFLIFLFFNNFLYTTICNSNNITNNSVKSSKSSNTNLSTSKKTTFTSKKVNSTKLNFMNEKSLLNYKAKLNFNNKAAVSNSSTNVDNEDNDDKDILWEGWIKYIKKEDDGTVSNPRKFLVNDDFFSQHVEKKDVMLMDEKKVFKNIVGQFYFYAKFSKHTFNILSSRNLGTTKNRDSISIKLIDHVYEDPKLRYSGAVQPLGEMKEGYCLKVSTREPFTVTSARTMGRKEPINRTICTNSMKDRDTLVEYFIDGKIHYQRLSKGIDGKTMDILAATNLGDLNKIQDSVREGLTRGRVTNPKDGRWILLQDWSECSQKCGKGKQFQHWMCVPAKPGGKPCEGRDVLERWCNEQPCPDYGNHDNSLYKGGVKTLQPIIKSIPFYNRPQQFIMCKIKESDVLFDAVTKIGEIEKITRIPARLNMNNHSISIHQDDDYIKSDFNFPLNKTSLSISQADHCCLLIKSQMQTFNFCGGFGTDCGTKSNPKFAMEWLRDFDLFKKRCFSPMKEEVIDKLDDEAAKEAMNQMKMDMVNQTSDMINAKLEKIKNGLAMSKMKDTQTNAVKVLKKEFNLEEMLAKEEQLRALNETKSLLKQKQNESKKMKCLEDALKAKEEEQKKRMANRLLLQNISKLQDDTMKEVKEQRDLLKQRIANIRKKNQLRNRQIKREINIIRSKMTKGLLDADRLGDMNKCKVGMDSEANMKTYCDDHINTTIEGNTGCKDRERFCFICCDNEFGSIQITQREKCYNLCENLLRTLNAGDWTWTPTPTVFVTENKFS